MSRYSIPSNINPAHTIHYGYDRPLQEFFVQVTTTELDDNNPGRSADLILMLGTENVLFPDPKNPTKQHYSSYDLLQLIKDYGGELPEHHTLGLVMGFEF